jgi:hypothetical protein
MGKGLCARLGASSTTLVGGSLALFVIVGAHPCLLKPLCPKPTAGAQPLAPPRASSSSSSRWISPARALAVQWAWEWGRPWRFGRVATPPRSSLSGGTRPLPSPRSLPLPPSFTRPPLRSSEHAGLPATPPAARRMELEGEGCAVGPFVSLPPFLGRPCSPSGTNQGAWAPGLTAWAGAAAVDGCRAPPRARQATAARASRQLRLLRGDLRRQPLPLRPAQRAPRSLELAKIELPL